ncbi:MAG: tRNA (adenosine(37)-N6)-dimethylallyltransferase MiaA [Flavobacteriaceae bacterium]|jgi:tRNA dimethylallyltransferase|nr:tRNA (adenosine(37)-N6)-dimethylallyltransferase MiaA [Flavobacteriaceae bacterium]MDO7581247.1 tRNA (adenosine(37)-N6)-dimethylallyltransferase MiaA [Flavobacteriaceae bacterium]MDO7603159.1 tRNA (adenosine(37)-N6)-dimethylallyltransferase MiaA [Flavobacteriaceae bacterium]
MNSKRLLYVAGPTASGKTALAIALAKHFDTEIVSCDSRQFYKEMTLGTAVPNSEELAAAPHHFIQQRSIREPYSVGDFQREALKTLKTLFKTKDTVILVGGSGMYADALIDGLDVFPEIDSQIRLDLIAKLHDEGIEALSVQLKKLDLTYYEKVDLDNPHRLIRALEVCLESGLPYSSFLGNKKAPDFFTTKKIVIQWKRQTLYQRINLRVDQIVAAGLEEEARKLYPNKNENALQTVGYREWFIHFDGTTDKATAIEEIKKNTRRYAKRQITWFKRYSDAVLVEGGGSVEKVLENL